MDRRAFLATTGLSGICLALAETLDPVEQAVAESHPGDDKLRPAKFGFSKKYNEISLTKGLPNETMHGSGEESPAYAAAVQPPLAFLYYDIDQKRFLSAKNVQPSLTDKSKKYKLNATLHSFGVSDPSSKALSKIKGNLQLGVNVGAPIEDDTLSWVFMSAVDVFLERGNSARRQALAKFENYSPTASLKPQSQIVIPGDTMTLQVSAYGQPKESIWGSLFHKANAVANSPLLGVLAIPSLVSESLNFVDSVFSQISQKNRLLTIWETMQSTFGIFQDTQQLYRFRPGYWTLVDLDYAKKTNGLAGHSLEIDYGSFQLLNGLQSSSSPADANYLVAELTLQPQ